MKFVVVGAEARPGMVHQEWILDLAAAARADGSTDDAKAVFGSLRSLIEAGDRGLDLASTLLERFGGSDQPGVNLELASTPLLAPFPGRRFALAGANNAAHVAAWHNSHGQPTTAEEVRTKSRKGRAGGFWVVTDPVGPEADIQMPRTADGLFDYEAEVAVVIGTGGKRLRAEVAQQHIWGATLVIDWSIRGEPLQRPWYGHKNFDSSKSIGPWIAVGEVDPMNVEVETRVNGEVRQRFTTGADMIYSYAELLEQMTEDLTLYPGDLLAGGTGPGTAVDSTPVGPDGSGSLDLYLKPGDTVEVSAPELGSLKAHVVAST